MWFLGRKKTGKEERKTVRDERKTEVAKAELYSDRKGAFLQLSKWAADIEQSYSSSLTSFELAHTNRAQLHIFVAIRTLALPHSPLNQNKFKKKIMSTMNSTQNLSQFLVLDSSSSEP